MWPLEHNSVYDKQGMDFKQGYGCRMPYIFLGHVVQGKKVSQMIKKSKLNEAEAKVEISPPRPTRRCSCSSPPT